MNNDEQYYLISKSETDEINSKIVVLNRGVQFMQRSETLLSYIKEIEVIINNTYKCDVVPRNKDNDR